MDTSLLLFLDAQRDTVIRRQRELTARPALGPENGGTGEAAKAAWILGELERMGVTDVATYPCPDTRVPSGLRPNIVARIPGIKPQTLWIIGHMDVVPPGEEGLWVSSPYELRVEGDFVYGRGVEDNQQAIVSALLVADALLSKGITPEYSLGLLFVADEETGMKHGLPHVLCAMPECIGMDDLVLVPDMGKRDGSLIEIAEKSCLWLRFEVTGKQCHASTPEQGVNSLVAASACVLALKELHDCFDKHDPLYAPAWSTFVPSKKEANVDNVNTLPGRDVFYLDCRVLPVYDLVDIEKECQRIAEVVAKKYSAHIQVSVVHHEQAPAPTLPTAPVVKRLQKALQAMRGIQGVLCGSGGQTVAAPLRHMNIPVAVWATLMPNPHTPNECSRISSTIEDAKVILYMLLDANSTI